MIYTATLFKQYFQQYLLQNQPLYLKMYFHNPNILSYNLNVPFMKNPHLGLKFFSPQPFFSIQNDKHIFFSVLLIEKPSHIFSSSRLLGLTNIIKSNQPLYFMYGYEILITYSY